MDPGDLLAAAARRHRSGVAAHCAGGSWTWDALHRLAGRVGAALARAGARPGDRVAAVLPNCHLFVATYFAALERGFVLVPLNLRLVRREVEGILEHAGAMVVAGEADRLDAIEAAIAERVDGLAVGRRRSDRRAVSPVEAATAPSPGAPDEAAPAAPAPPEGAALLYYTSGTTGRPKGVILTRANLAAHLRMTLDELRFAAADVWLHAAPMFHLADAWAVFTATAAGAAHVLLRAYDGAEAARLMRRHGVTLTNLVPTMIPPLLQAAAAERARLRLRLLLSGGAPIAPRLARDIEAVLGCEYAQTYGLTETSPFLTFSLPDARTPAETTPEERVRRAARTGRPARGVDLRVVTPASAAAFDDVPRDDRSVGEVVVRGATVTPGYWRDPEATRQAFLGGWFHTGDLGTWDRAGSLQLVDRAKEVIVTGGETVYSLEVESVLLEHPAVIEAAVFAVPDERWGESVRAAVALGGADGTTEEDLAAFCRERLAGFKCPRAIDRLDRLPRLGSGKIDKRGLREPFWSGRPRRIH